MYILGILTGLLIAIICLLLDARREKSLVSLIEEKGKRQAKGSVIEPLLEVEEAREEVVRRNEVQGRDTRLEELDL